MGERAERRKRAEPLSVWAHPPAVEAKAGGKDLPRSASSGASGSPLSFPPPPLPSPGNNPSGNGAYSFPGLPAATTRSNK